MKRITFILAAVAAVTGVIAFTASASRHTDQEAAPIFVTKIPLRYRDCKLISVALGKGNLNDNSAILAHRRG